MSNPRKSIPVVCIEIFEQKRGEGYGLLCHTDRRFRQNDGKLGPVDSWV